MHEGAIAQNIAKMVEGELVARGLKSKVKKIIFQVGKMNAVIPDTLKFYFDIVKEGRPQLEDAELEVKEIPLVVHCPTCDKSFEIEEPFFLCLKCRSPLSIESGKEMFIESFFLEDEP